MNPVLGFFLSAILGALSFPPVGWWPLAYVAMVPFLHAAVSLTPRRALRWGFLSGLVFFGALLYWIGLNSGAPAPLSAASCAVVISVLATVWASVAWGVSKVSLRFGLPTAMLFFVSFYMFWEVFWGVGELGFPWAIWGLTQSGFLTAAQMADFGDVWLISLWVLSLNALVFLYWKNAASRRILVIAICAVLLLPILYGIVRLQQVRGGTPIAVAAVQANTQADEKWEIPAEEIAQSYLDTSAPLAQTDTRLVVWPETATPTAIRFRPWLRTALQNFADSTGMTLLTGATDYKTLPDKGRVPYNAAFLIRPGERELLNSAKIHLVPFGERIPLQKHFPFLRKLHLGQAEWEPGERAVVFPEHNGIPLSGCLVCYEVMFPEIAADLITGGARILTNITNDGWYGHSSEPYQHLALTQLRAIAVRRSIVRSANTGISALILPTGHMTRSMGFDRAGFVFGELPARDGITIAVRLARFWLPFYSLLFLAVLVSLWKKTRRRVPEQNAPQSVAA